MAWLLAALRLAEQEEKHSAKEDQGQEIEEEPEEAAELAPLLDPDAGPGGDVNAVIGQSIGYAGAGLFTRLVALIVQGRDVQLVPVDLYLLDLIALGHGYDVGQSNVLRAVGWLEEGKDNRDYRDDYDEIDEAASHVMRLSRYAYVPPKPLYYERRAVSKSSPFVPVVRL